MLMPDTQTLMRAVPSCFCHQQVCLLTPDGSWDSADGQHIPPGNAMLCCPMGGNIGANSPVTQCASCRRHQRALTKLAVTAAQRPECAQFRYGKGCFSRHMER